jgi:hypothetical protein
LIETLHAKELCPNEFLGVAHGIVKQPPEGTYN